MQRRRAHIDQLGECLDLERFREVLLDPGNRPGHSAQPAIAKISQGILDAFWTMSMSAGFLAAYECVKAFSETDFREDPKRFDVPTLVIHGDDDQIVPLNIAGAKSSKMIKGATLKGGPAFRRATAVGLIALGSVIGVSLWLL